MNGVREASVKGSPHSKQGGLELLTFYSSRYLQIMRKYKVLGHPEPV